MPARRVFWASVLWALLLLAWLPACAQQPITGSPAPPDKVRELLSLMNDPEVRLWLGQREEAAAPAELTPATMRADITAPVIAVRQHFLASLAAIPTASAEKRSRWTRESCTLPTCTMRSPAPVRIRRPGA